MDKLHNDSLQPISQELCEELKSTVEKGNWSKIMNSGCIIFFGTSVMKQLLMLSRHSEPW
jgi:activator of 2-hydroxyglutaryl-CoA dehydratase